MTSPLSVRRGDPARAAVAVRPALAGRGHRVGAAPTGDRSGRSDHTAVIRHRDGTHPRAGA
ncbi:hypothetical protein [Saccharothrix algeriensis]|uniref:Uncharacterized protein n=1 Tax=Saccharothrix algeriensis TaxID=173560 RepID=A0A8T8HSX2_9PSEU|nr:hypothetical protein [Saccharothrix algeriensis]MBM7813006.1 hypothetical protein [Saccharothrix algeriensis]QTR01625.1 hypothetical protein J7S33_20025 [Saccharothrix algeriensis]